MPNSSKQNNVAGSAGFLAIGQAISVSLKFLLIPILARALSPEIFGIANVCLAFIAFLTCLAGYGGLSSAIIVFDKNNINAWRKAYSFNLVLSAFMIIIIFIFAGSIGNLLGIKNSEDYIRVISLLLPLIFTSELLSSYLIKESKTKFDASLTVFADIIGSVIAIILAFQGFGVWALIFQQIVFYLIRILIVSLNIKLFPELSLDFSSLTQYFKYVYNLTLSEVVNYFGVWFPNILVSRIAGVSAAGLFSVSNRISSLPVDIISNSLSKVLLNAFSNATDLKTKQDNLIWSSVSNTVLLVPVLFGAAALSEPLINLVLGDKFQNAALVFMYLAIAKALVAPCYGYYSFLKANNQSESLLKLMVFRSLLIVAAVLIGLKLDGLNGAALGIALAGIPILIFYTIGVNKIAQLSFLQSSKHTLLIYLITLIMFIFVYSADYYFASVGLNDLLRIVIGLFIGGTIYIGAIFAYSLYNFKNVKYDGTYINYIKHLIFRKF